MARPRRRKRLALRVESLEIRSLLSSDVGNGLLIGFAPGTNAGTVAATVQRFQGQVLQKFPDGPVWIQPGAGVNVARVETWMQNDPAVRYVEPNGVIHVDSIPPNDPGFNQQWGLYNAGTGVDINALNAWQTTQGSSSTIIAVIDSGLDLTNPDFSGRLWVNTAEATGQPGVDDSHDGYVDDVFGWNFRDHNNNLADYAQHGTHVAGLIAANANDHYGVAGVNWNARIMPLKFIGPDGSGNVADAVQAIYYAVNHGARIINASWGGIDYSQSLNDAISYADSHGVVFVTAAGNESANNDTKPSYPALDRLGNLISVAAVDAFGRLASFSNYGPNTVDIAAPGVSILSDLPGGGLVSYSGTSMSTPFVTGVASLVAGMHPTWNAEQIVHQVVATAKPMPTLRGLIASGGIVDAAAAVGSTAPPTTTTTPPPVSVTSNPTIGVSEPSDLIHAQIVSTDEFYQAHGGTNTSWLNALYQTFLDRSLDPGARTYWLGQLAASDRLTVAHAIIYSPEAIRTKVAGWMKSDLGWTATIADLKTIPVVIQWSNVIAAAGGADSVIHQIILASSEFYNRSGGTDASWLNAVYQVALGRPLDSGARTYWLGQLATGRGRSDIALTILASLEARTFKVATWFHNDLGRSTPIATLKNDPTVIALAREISD